MKTELTSLDLHYLVKEFQELVGARVDKFYEQSEDKKEFLFVFHKSGAGKLMLRIHLPNIAYLTEYKQVFPETPPGFCVFLRKHLGSGKIKQVRQKGFDRILEIVFDTKEGVRILICELFSKGNMVLVDEDYKIKGLLESQNWEARTVRGGAKYEYPPSQAATSELGEDQIKEIVAKSNKDSIVKTLAMDLGLGGLYAEEACSRANIGKDKKELGSDELKRVVGAVKELFNHEIKANKVNDEIVPFYLAAGATDKSERVDYDSFSKALDDSLSIKAMHVAEDKVIKEKQTKQDKTRIVIEKQEQRLKELEQGIADNQRKGEMIYEHYQEIKELLDNINLDRKKMGWDELKKKYKDNKLIKSINEKEGKIVVEL
ncbi:NFACT family protein [Candidatus Woesearchaeota archaeon]|nr:NFACT family protein [Candidatus Woesearchaeota archaeon]